MKIFLTLFVLITFYVNTQAQNQMENLNTIIQNVKDKFAPDKRTALFNVEAVEDENVVIIKGETNLPEAKVELDKGLKQTKINFTDKIELLPSEKLNGKIYGVINLSVANCRSKPDHPAELVTQSIMGTPVKVLKKGQDGYYLVQTPDGYISWLDDDGVQFMDKDEFNSWISSDKVIFTANYGLCYSNPDDKSQTVSDLVAGNILKYLGDEQNYFKVEYPDKRIGYIKKDDAKLFNDWYKSLNPKANDILSTAYRFMGTPYL
ncbi:MAG TPA: SH3 domain-containing protein, partial [Ignavibacteriaceae bacterium]|nr:SH3 domain-containing protein [Ignavibacteriaceae bacterium]